MERSENNFEKAWKDLFEGAETSPREDVWTKIESGVANRMLGRYRRKILFYKLLAAASLVLAMGIGYFSYRGFPGGVDDRSGSGIVAGGENSMNAQDSDGDDKPLAGNVNDNDEPASDEMSAAGEEPEEIIAGNIAARDEAISAVESGKDSSPVERLSEGNPSPVAVLEEREGSTGTAAAQGAVTLQPDLMNAGPFLTKSRKGLSLGGLPVQPGLMERKQDPSEDEWYAIYEQTLKEESEKEDRQELWAGVNFSSGVFDPNISYGNHSAGMLNAIAPDASYDLIRGDASSFTNFTKAVQPEETSFNSEVSFAYGVHVGYQVSPRFVIRGGLSYINSNTSTEITSYIDNPASNRKIAYQALNSVSIESAGVNTINQSSEEIRMNYTYEFISLPVSLGYYLVDKKFEWMVMAGLSTDFFLKNTFSDEKGMFGKTEITAGEESPYNLSYLNGTFGTLFGMSFSERYRISLEPSYRLGLTEFTKESATGVSQPSSFYITAGISYIFR